MPVNYDPDRDSSDFVDDTAKIGRRAMTRAERRNVLDQCLQQDWASASIGRIEREETATRSGWRMYPYRS
jgi:hypothetical protein